MQNLKNIILLLIAGIVMTPGYGQRKVKELIKLGRDSIISKAKIKLEREYPTFNFDEFSNVRALASDEHLYVNFSVPYRYVPLNSEAIYSMSVFLGGNLQFSATHLSNGEKPASKPDFYQPDENYHRVIAFIIKATENDKSISSIKENTEVFGHVVSIYEKEDHYKVSIDSRSTSSGYKVSKADGVVSGHWHKHKANTNPLFEEIE
ncbi:MAG: hypothetical protein R3345_08690 [Fulvivirga sp.]|nr:hypothetical protein [Fulvivirga sp.]